MQKEINQALADVNISSVIMSLVERSKEIKLKSPQRTDLIKDLDEMVRMLLETKLHYKDMHEELRVISSRNYALELEIMRLRRENEELKIINKNLKQGL